MDSRAEIIFGELQGAWAFSRIMSGYGTMEGKAVFTPSAPGILAYREDGLLKMQDGPVFEGFREYIYKLEDGKNLVVYFKDGRLFHPLTFDGAIAAGSHLCSQDFYQATYVFEDDDHFSLTWDIKGPKKDYRINTHYTKLTTDL